MEMQNEKPTPLSRFFRLLQPDKKDILKVYFYAILSGLINLSLPLGIQAIITYISGGMITTSWVVLVIFVIMGIVMAGLMQVMQASLVETIQQRIFQRSAFEFAFRIPRIKLEKIASYYAPELINRFFDTLTLQKGLSKILLDFSASIVQIIFGLILLGFYHPFFILFGLFLVVILYIIIRFTGPIGLKTSIEESSYKYKVAYWLEEMARTMNTFKLAGKTDLPERKTDALVSGYLNARKNHFRVLISQFMSIIGFKAVVTGGLLILGSLLVLDSQINLGQFVAAEIIIILIVNSVEKLIFSMEPVYDVLTALEKIGSITDLPLDRKGGIDLGAEAKQKPMRVAVKNLTFGSSMTGKPLLSEVNFSVEPGERVVIHGFNASGKETLMQLLGGLYEDYEGVISLNGHPQRSINPNSLRSLVGDSLNQEEIFAGCIRDNLCLGKSWVNNEDIERAAKALNLSDYISELPEGMQTEVMPGGQGLPENIVRKIKIARSIVESPPLVIWQENLHYFTPTDRSLVIDQMFDRTKPWTLFVSSGNLSLAERADRILLLDKGKLIFNGTFSELQTNEKCYAAFI